jgi:tetratricopeptide (TPR) repeat protein
VCWRLRGKAYFQSDRSIEAIKDFTRALELEPDHFDALLGRGLAYSKIENYSASIDDLQRASAARRADELSAFALATSALADRRPRLAQRVLESFPEWSPEIRGQVERLRETIAQFAGLIRAALNAFGAVRNRDELYRALQEHPILRQEELLSDLQTYVDRQEDDAVRENLQARFDGLLDLLQDPARAAFDSFVAARDLEAMKEAPRDHPILEDSGFVQHLEKVARSQDDLAKSSRLELQLKLLKRCKPC